jgi:hypothetical protein
MSNATAGHPDAESHRRAGSNLQGPNASGVRWNELYRVGSSHSSSKMAGLSHATVQSIDRSGTALVP